MAPRCEVCAQLRPDTLPSGARIREILFGRRQVALCAAHARITELVRVTTFQGLRGLYRENGGKRSLVPRRREEPAAPLDGERRSRGDRRTGPARRRSGS